MTRFQVDSRKKSTSVSHSMVLFAKVSPLKFDD